MGQRANQVCVLPDDIQRLEKWIIELAVNARVCIHLRNRDTIEGTVAVTPTVQMFRDPDGQEGVNGRVKLIDIGESASSALIWLQ